MIVHFYDITCQNLCGHKYPSNLHEGVGDRGKISTVVLVLVVVVLNGWRLCVNIISGGIDSTKIKHQCSKRVTVSCSWKYIRNLNRIFTGVIESNSNVYNYNDVLLGLLFRIIV